MKLLSLKIKILMILIFSSSISVAQKKIDVKYYSNKTKLTVENVRIYLVTKSDTIDLEIIEEKVKIPQALKDNFSLFAQFEGKTIKIGSFRPGKFKDIGAIVIGRVTDFSIMKRHYSNNTAFRIAEEYWINVPNAVNITDYIYGFVGSYINLSNNSNFTDYFPTVNGYFEVIKTKN